MVKSLLLSFALFGTCPHAARADEAATVLARMEQRYAALPSYADEGIVLLHREGSRDGPNETAFQTQFVRPGKFMFAWTTRHPFPPLSHIKWTSTIWSDGKSTYSKFGFGPENAAPKQDESFDMAIAGATGVSFGTASHISGLLMPGPRHFAFGAAKLSALQALADEAVEGVRCDHLRGQSKHFGPVDLWIGKDDGLLRKISMKLNTSLQEVFYRNQRVNIAIADSTFVPPP